MNDKRLWKIFSEFIRLRDSDENGYCRCFTCGRVKFWTEVDCGHGIGRQHLSTKYSEKNNHAQCKKCNGFEEGRKDVYKRRVDEIYGQGTWDKLEVQSRQPFKFGDLDLKFAEIHYKDLVNQLKKQKGLV